MKRYFVVSGGLVPLLAFTAWGQTPQQEDESQQKVIYQAIPERVPAGKKPTGNRKPPTPITLSIPQAFRAGNNVYDLGTPTPTRVAQADQSAAQNNPGIPRVGFVRTIKPTPLSVQNGFGKTKAPDGSSVRVLAIRSPTAFGLRVHFTQFDMGSGSVLVYARRPDGTIVVRGPFTGKGPNRTGDFWTSSLPGETVFLEVTGTDKPQFEIPEVLHFDHDIGFAQQQSQNAGGTTRALSCELDAMCYSWGTGYAFARDATGQMNFVKGGNSFVCTGTLLNDLDGATTVPYFLTAHHCLSSQAAANTLEVVWLYQKDACNGTLPNYSTLPRNVGATLVSTTSSSDMSFFRLYGGLPGGIALAGWTTATSAGVYGVHHPGGSWKRAVGLDSVGFCPGCACWSGSTHDYYNMIQGLTEPGSSGSGVFNNAGQLGGQLHGCCSAFHDCANKGCSNISNYWAVYGEFEETYPLIKRWLQIGGTIHVNRSTFPPPGNGTPGWPFVTVAQANSLAWDGTRIMIHTGSYPEVLTINKQVTLNATGGLVTIGQ